MMTGELFLKNIELFYFLAKFYKFTDKILNQFILKKDDFRKI